MKKRLLISSLFLLLLVTGCGDNVSSTSNNENGYTVNVVYPDGTPVNGNVRVEWCTSTSCSKSITIDSNGKATSTDLEDGEYYVHINNLPEGYAYNPDIYYVDSSNKNVTITLSKILTYKSGDGSKYEDGTNLGPYVVKEGVYNVCLQNSDSYLYYAFEPSTPGKYIVESWSLMDDPVLDYYSNTTQMIPDTPSATSDNEVNNNFKYSFEISSKDYGASNSGYTMIFGVSNNGNAKNVEFPINFECVEKYDFYQGGNNDTSNEVKATNVPKKYTKPEDSKLKSMAYDGSVEVVFNETDKLYHIGNNDGAYVLANITSINDYMIESFADSQSSMPSSLIINEKDYNKFIDSYEEIVNEDGVCLVTQELKEFLDEYMKVDRGYILGWFGDEYNPSYSWLACCSYYDSNEEKLESSTISIDSSLLTYGELISTYIVNTNTFNEITIPFDSNSFNEYTLISNDSNIKISYENKDYLGKDGINILMNSNDESDIKFTVTSMDNSNKEVSFKLYYGNENLEKTMLGENFVELSGEYQDMVFIADEDAKYNISALKDSNIMIKIDDTTYDSSENAISIDINLSANELVKFSMKLIDTNKSKSVQFKINKIKVATLGNNDLEFNGASLLDGLNLSFTAPLDGEYIFIVGSYYASDFSLKINNENYTPDSTGLVTKVNLNKNQTIDLLAKYSSYEDAYVSLRIENVKGYLSSGDNSLTLTKISEYNTTSCFIFKATEKGSYVITTKTFKNKIGACIEYNGDSYGPVSQQESITISSIELEKDQMIILFISYSSIEFDLELPNSFDVVVNIELEK